MKEYSKMKPISGKVTQRNYPAFSISNAANKGGMGSGIGKNPKMVLGKEPSYPGIKRKM